eukprot:388834-Rhodomonas_salina.2
MLCTKTYLTSACVSPDTECVGVGQYQTWHRELGYLVPDIARNVQTEYVSTRHGKWTRKRRRGTQRFKYQCVVLTWDILLPGRGEQEEGPRGREEETNRSEQVHPKSNAFAHSPVQFVPGTGLISQRCSMLSPHSYVLPHLSHPMLRSYTMSGTDTRFATTRMKGKSGRDLFNQLAAQVKRRHETNPHGRNQTQTPAFSVQFVPRVRNADLFLDDDEADDDWMVGPPYAATRLLRRVRYCHRCRWYGATACPVVTEDQVVWCHRVAVRCAVLRRGDAVLLDEGQRGFRRGGVRYPPPLTVVARLAGTSFSLQKAGTAKGGNAQAEGEAAGGGAEEEEAGAPEPKAALGCYARPRPCPVPPTRTWYPKEVWRARSAVLFWDCSGTVLGLFGCCLGTVRILFRYGSGTALGLFRYGSGTVQGLFRDCSGAVQGLFRDCSGTVEGLFRDCSGTVQGLSERFRYGSGTERCLFVGQDEAALAAGVDAALFLDDDVDLPSDDDDDE